MVPALEACEPRLVLNTVSVPNPGPAEKPPALKRGLQPIPFEAFIRQGPRDGLSLKGTLNLSRVGGTGVRGELDTGAGTIIPARGTLNGRRLVLSLDVGAGRVLRAEGQVRKVPLAGGGYNLTGQGRFAVRGTPDRGVWGANYQAGVHIQFDYSLDTNGFFNDPARRVLLQSAADALTSRLQDTLTEIASPQPIPGTSFTNTWTAQLSNPATGATTSIKDLFVPRDTIIVYAGGRDLPGSTLGVGGPGGFSGSGTQAFLDNVRARGQGTRTASGATGALAATPTDVGPWGGSITFDTVGTNWFFGATLAGIRSNQSDFLSVATHELGHLLGINGAPAFTRLISGNTFIGQAARNAYGGIFVPVETGASIGHWAEGVRSPAGIGQEVAMDPSLLTGTRKLFTAIDFAGLADIGWQVGSG